MRRAVDGAEPGERDHPPLSGAASPEESTTDHDTPADPRQGWNSRFPTRRPSEASGPLAPAPGRQRPAVADHSGATRDELAREPVVGGMPEQAGEAPSLVGYDAPGVGPGGAGQPVGVASDLRVAGYYADRALRKAGRADTDARRLDILLPPARRVRDGLRSLLHHDGVWTSIRNAEDALSTANEAERLDLSRALDQDLAGLLVRLDHREPPSIRRMAEALRAGIDRVCAAPAGMAGLKAREGVYLYTYLLRQLVTTAEAGTADPDELRRSAREVAAALRIGVAATAAGALAASAAGLARSPVGVEAPAAAPTDGGHELIKRAVEAGSAAVLRTCLSIDGFTAVTSQLKVRATALTTAQALFNVSASVEIVSDSDQRERQSAIESRCIAVIHAAYDALKAAALDPGSAMGLDQQAQQALVLGQETRTLVYDSDVGSWDRLRPRILEHAEKMVMLADAMSALHHLDHR
jgi:hypothetical protein